MERSGLVTEMIDRIDRISIDAMESALLRGGWVCPPMLHMLCEGWEWPYVGHVCSRPFYRGPDAAAAVQGLGVLPTALGVTHLVAVWEMSDLCTALELSGGEFPTGLVVLEASRGHHILRWHPCRFQVGPMLPSGFPEVRPEWGPPIRYPNARLLGPVEDLLAGWRRGRVDGLASTLNELTAAGYRIELPERSGVDV